MPELLPLVAASLGVGGTAEAGLEGFRARPEQVEYAARVASLLEMAAVPGAPKIALLQGSTGVGKTLGYLVPVLAYAAATGRRVAIATHSIDLLLSLPEQIESAKIALATLMDAGSIAGLSVAVRVGRPEYLCESAVQDLLDRCEPGDRARQRVLNSLLNHARTVGLLRLWDGQLPDDIPASAVLLSDEAELEDQQVYQRDLARAAAARVLLCTQTSVILSAVDRSNVLRPDGEEPVSALVIDEADALPGMAEAILQNSVPLRDVEARLQAMGGAGAALRASARLSDAVAAAISSNEDVSFLTRPADSGHRRKIAQLIGELVDATSAAIKGKRRSAIVAELRSDLFHLQRTASALSGGVAYGMPYVRTSDVRHYPGLGVADPYPGSVVGRLMGDATRQLLQHVVLTSATLTPVAGEHLDAFARLLRLAGHEADVSGAVEPARFGSLEFVFSAPDVALPYEKQDGSPQLSNVWVEHFANVVLQAAAAGGRTLVLTPSYSDGVLVREWLEDLGDRLLIQSREPGSRASCIEQFRARRDAVWISPTSWEGLDLPGLIKQLVIARLPYPGLDSSAIAAREQMARRGGHSVQSARGVAHRVARGICMRRLAQGLGRPIRKDSDSATVWIADPRFGLPTVLIESLLEQGILSEAPSANHYLSIIPRRHLDALRRPGRARVMTLEGALCA